MHRAGRDDVRICRNPPWYFVVNDAEYWERSIGINRNIILKSFKDYFCSKMVASKHVVLEAQLFHGKMR